MIEIREQSTQRGRHPTEGTQPARHKNLFESSGGRADQASICELEYLISQADG